MCTIGLALMAASTAVSYDGQRTQAKYQNQLNARNRDAALQSYRDSTASLQLQDQQNFAGAQQAAEQNSREAQRVAATARVSAGESGATGSTIDALFREIMGQGAANESSIYTNYLRSRQDTENQMRGLNQQVSNTMMNLTPVQGPSLLGAGLKIGAGVADYYSDVKTGKYGQTAKSSKGP